MAFDINTAKPVSGPASGGFDISTAKPVADQPVAPESPSGWDGALAQFAQNISMAPGQILDMPSHVVNWIAEKAGSDFRMPATMEENQRKLMSAGSEALGMGEITGEPYMGEGWPKEFVQAGSNAALFAAGALPVARAPSAVSLAEDIAGIGSTRAPGAAGVASVAADGITQGYAPVDIPVDTQRKLAILRREGDATQTPGYKVDYDPKTGRSELAPNPVQKQAMSQGLDERIVAQIQSTSPKDRGRVGEMLDYVERGLKDKTTGDFEYPRVVLGRSLGDRYRVVRDVNKRAGAQVARESEALQNAPFDAASYQQNVFGPTVDDMRGLGIEITPDGLDFSRSVFEIDGGSQSAIEDAYRVLKNAPDKRTSAELHRIKKILDNEIDFPAGGTEKNKQAVENFLMTARTRINNDLRSRFPGYAEANDLFAESKEQLKEAQRLAGKGRDITDEVLGRLARRQVSNAQSADDMRSLVTGLDELAVKYGGQFDDDLRLQTSLVQSLESMFPYTKPPSSFGGEISKAANPAKAALDVASGNYLEAAKSAVESAVKPKTVGYVQSEIDKINLLKRVLNAE